MVIVFFQSPHSPKNRIIFCAIQQQKSRRSIHVSSFSSVKHDHSPKANITAKQYRSPKANITAQQYHYRNMFVGAFIERPLR
jgi:hypothetical protein